MTKTTSSSSETLDKLRSLSRGGRFFRVDLHIHSFGEDGSYDVNDASMTPAAIVETALTHDLGVISITDHNKIGNVKAAIQAAEGKALLVVPGVELSTSSGHFLVYAESFDLLRRIYGALEFSENYRDCLSGIKEILTAVQKHNGVVIPAHIELEKGLEQKVPGFGEPKRSIVTSPVVVAVEIATKEALSLYTDQDPEAARKELLKKRLELRGDPFCQILPRIRSSDAHSIAALGRNFEKKEKLTRLKLGELSWSAFRAAFQDPEARLRLEDEIPERVPSFKGLKISGGFLREQLIPLSTNLTCVIGGRGSGKSMAFHAICSTALPGHTTPYEGSSVWPRRLELLFVDRSGQEHLLSYDSATGDISNLGNPGQPLPAIEVDMLTQGKLAQDIEGCGRDPSILLKFLDDLTDLSKLHESASQCREALVENGSQILDLTPQVLQEKELQRVLDSDKAQLQQAEKSETKKLIAYQESLTKAIDARKRLLPQFQDVLRTVSESLSLDPISELQHLSDSAGALAKTPEENPFPEIMEELRQTLGSAQTAIATVAKSSKAKVSVFAELCAKRQAALQEKIEAEVAELKKLGINPDITFLNGLTKRIHQTEQQIKQIKLRKAELLKLRKARRKLLQDYQSKQADVFKERSRLATSLKLKLENFLVDWSVAVRFSQGTLSPHGRDALRDVMSWRTSSVPKADLLIDQLGVPALLDAIERKDEAALSLNGDISTADTKKLLDRFAEEVNLFRLQQVDYQDCPSIVVSRPAVDDSGNPLPGPRVTREFSRLSMGQQQSIVLAIMLSVETDRPLLVDQPEDNLDSAFVFRVLVRALRRIKESRQVILITHNANIAVLGDADLIVPLKATSARSMVQNAGMVENPATRRDACEILEGGQDAYRRRGELYGL